MSNIYLLGYSCEPNVTTTCSVPYPGAVTRATKEQLAEAVWRAMLDYSFAHREKTLGVAAELGLTPGHVKCLFALDPESPCSMGELAEVQGCDPSSATWLVDRLEERGLVERRPHPRDRRVKSVVLTPEGETTKKALIDRLAEPPTDLRDLDRAALETLRDALERLPATPAFWDLERPER